VSSEARLQDGANCAPPCVLRLSHRSQFGKNQKCQKCLQIGHWTYECKGKAVYKKRPSRTQQLADPSLKRSVGRARCQQSAVQRA
jgi:hypothetical protein